MTLIASIKDHPSYKKYSVSWSDDVSPAFFKLLELYNQKSLDIYFRDPTSNKWEVCVGRREYDASRAIGIYIAFRFTSNGIEYKFNHNISSLVLSSVRGKLTEKRISELNELELLSNFVTEYNISRLPHIPTDYTNTETPHLDSFFSAMIASYQIDRNDWYISYQKIVSTVLSAKNETDISDQLLRDLWYSRDNYISSLKQGALSKEEFELSKSTLKNITKKIINSQSLVTYQECVEDLQKLKDDGKVKDLHKALLNRVFAVAAPQHFSTTVTKDAFEYICSYFTQNWGFKYKYSNWFSANIKLKEFIRNNLNHEYDELLINIVLWVIYKEKHLSDLASRESDITLKTAIRKQVESIEIQFREAELERQFIQWLHNSEYCHYAISSQSEDLGRAHIRDVVLKSKETNTTLIAELKFKSNAKEDIEAAIGQLLRYALYPNTEDCSEIWVVGGNYPLTDELTWFNEIKKHVNLKLKYFYKDPQSNQFFEE
ncbi:ATPase [Pseudoalteromonas sp. ACER1]|uniref:ATPase n=2 Tax=unclassified Pseudoalteromonas TaxID=194690 RepID=UPI001F3C4A8D|nr:MULTISPECIES: ATPase [unclassified Pseudoalteromonas]MCF2849136.1 ATPase [Pseudoalteromonas sp. PAST1]MCO7212521.1 ATPase [Pseudoalteromonas sp. ACER1]|tara:strand:+ start:609 stop:2072 length:1464 start_codon:yes stop_codon:yes gene_type:complete